MSERDDPEAQARYGTLGEIAAVDRYGMVPLPRPDPRPWGQAERQAERAEAELAAARAARDAANAAELERYFPMGELSRKAGVMDISAAPRGTLPAGKVASVAQEEAVTGAMLRHVAGVPSDPERFHRIQQTWPESTNVEYRGDPTLLQRAQAWLPRQWFRPIGGYR